MNDNNHVLLLFNDVNPLTFNDETNVVLVLFNVVRPDTFYDNNASTTQCRPSYILLPIMN
jgi:hypothetical protein